LIEPCLGGSQTGFRLSQLQFQFARVQRGNDLPRFDQIARLDL